MANASSETGAAAAAPIGPGWVVLVVGPSGAGKDTLINLARAALAESTHIAFPKRVVTRAAGPAEDNIVVTPQEFASAEAEGCHCLSWRAHGLEYGVPRTIEPLIMAGTTVVLNVSRGVVGTARATFSNVAVVYIDAPVEMRAARLSLRGRETLADLAARLAASHGALAPTEADFVIINDQAPQLGAARLTAFLATR